MRPPYVLDCIGWSMSVLGSDHKRQTARKLRDLLPITPHVSTLEFAASKSYLTCVAGERMRLNSIWVERRLRNAGHGTVRHYGSHHLQMKGEFEGSKSDFWLLNITVTV